MGKICHELFLRERPGMCVIVFCTCDLAWYVGTDLAVGRKGDAWGDMLVGEVTRRFPDSNGTRLHCWFE